MKIEAFAEHSATVWGRVDTIVASDDGDLYFWQSAWSIEKAGTYRTMMISENMLKMKGEDDIKTN